MNSWDLLAKYIRDNYKTVTIKSEPAGGLENRFTIQSGEFVYDGSCLSSEETALNACIYLMRYDIEQEIKFEQEIKKNIDVRPE